MKRIYWDSCVLIYRLQAVPPWKEKIARLLAAQPAYRLVLTELTRLECRVKPLREGDVDTLRAFDHFFTSDRIEYAPLKRTLFDRAAELRAYHGLKTIDALHLAAALDAGCNAFWTNDRRLERAASERIQIVAIDALS
ncbi:type II toxin-antitoxin system VapC family toxin [Thiorhodococcus minor]|uniref:Ribonuclease VapC n=1 Tax=Thiorhodococcus minor TaxID=57489 RepID=A0A6M0K3R1_9GAMM|nr:type II toxin-antitoxin system VapC family toxin [Thiorhodococcus minor]NEV64432.1 type II toxin-antitoxin system VapC family toxin [Thiorhodococcus minor]